MEKFLKAAVPMNIILELPEGVPYKVPHCDYEKLIGTLVTISIINSFSPLRYLAQFNADNELLTLTKLTEGALRADGTDYLEREEDEKA